MKCNDTYIYAGTSAGNLYQLTTKPLKERNALCVHKKKITKLVRLPDGRIATSSHDTFIKVWEPVEHSFKCRKVLKGHTNYVADIAHAGGDLLVSCGQDLSLRLWNYQTKKVEQIVERAHDKVIEGVANTRRLLITCGGDCVVKLWNKRDLKEKMVLKGHVSNVFTVIGYNWMGDRKVISGSADPNVKIWDMNTGKCETTYGTKEDPIMSLGMINGNVLGAGSYDNKLFLFDVREGKELKKIIADDDDMMITGMIRSIIPLDMDRYFAAGSTDWNLRIYDMRSGNSDPLHQINLKDGIETLCTNSDKEN